MKKRFSHIVLSALLLFISFAIAAQEASVKATINRDKILIGEPIQLQLEATIPVGGNAKWFAEDTIPHFDFIEKSKIDSSKPGVYKQTVTITSFDSGRQVIPALSLEYNGKSYLTDSLAVFVSFSDFDPKKDYHDIKDIIEVKADINYLTWILIAAGVLLLLLLIWYLRKRRKKPAAPAQVFSNLSPLEEALRTLDELKQQPLDEKQFYTRLNDIIRWFVYRKTGVAAMQETNEQFILQIEKLGMPQDDFIALAQTLRLCDVVKFAKFIPSKEDKEHSLRVIRSSVQVINDKKPQNSPEETSAETKNK
jgi:LPXTG-motif cell wall-anchored protein